MAGIAWIINRHGVLVDVPEDRLEDILGLVPGSRVATADEVPGNAPASAVVEPDVETVETDEPPASAPKPVKKRAARRKSPPAEDAE